MLKILNLAIGVRFSYPVPLQGRLVGAGLFLFIGVRNVLSNLSSLTSRGAGGRFCPAALCPSRLAGRWGPVLPRSGAGQSAIPWQARAGRGRGERLRRGRGGR